MTLQNILIVLGGIGWGLCILCVVPLCSYIIFPFFLSFTKEKKFENFIDDECLQGNEIAISIRREGLRLYSERDYRLLKAAVQGDQNAIKALKLDRKDTF